MKWQLNCIQLWAKFHNQKNFDLILCSTLDLISKIIVFASTSRNIFLSFFRWLNNNINNNNNITIIIMPTIKKKITSIRESAEFGGFK